MLDPNLVAQRYQEHKQKQAQLALDCQQLLKQREEEKAFYQNKKKASYHITRKGTEAEHECSQCRAVIPKGSVVVSRSRFWNTQRLSYWWCNTCKPTEAYQ